MRCPRLTELPSPPAGKTGWPWTEETPPCPGTLPDGRPWPRISIVTPSFNQGQFIEETIRSVLLQGYPDLEYIVIDGGTADQSVEIIRKYAPWLAYWVSEKDRGQSHAINKGWARATGELLAWLNSDDTYLPKALAQVAGIWVQDDKAVAIVGAFHVTDAESHLLGSPSCPRMPQPGPLDLTLFDHESWMLPQQSAFWPRGALDQVGRFVREDLHYTMDRELYYRLCRTGRLSLTTEALATYRHHGTSKCDSMILKAFREGPKALAYCFTGNGPDNLRRQQVGRWRIAQGHFKYASRCPSRLGKLWHLAAAGVLRPSYVLRFGFCKHWLDAVFLYRPLRWFYGRLTGRATELPPG
jgi:glycosyltransferase involved in cell wall biosynthesis